MTQLCLKELRVRKLCAWVSPSVMPATPSTTPATQSARRPRRPATTKHATRPSPMTQAPRLPRKITSSSRLECGTQAQSSRKSPGASGASSRSVAGLQDPSPRLGKADDGVELPRARPSKLALEHIDWWTTSLAKNWAMPPPVNPVRRFVDAEMARKDGLI